MKISIYVDIQYYYEKVVCCLGSVEIRVKTVIYTKFESFAQNVRPLLRQYIILVTFSTIINMGFHGCIKFLNGTLTQIMTLGPFWPLDSPGILTLIVSGVVRWHAVLMACSIAVPSWIKVILTCIFTRLYI